MADHKQIVPFFIKWEGGKSNDVKDSASWFTCGVDGIHTNKGVTYQSWVSVFGENEVDRFLKMSQKDWGLIFKSKYWDAVKGDDIKSQAIANVLVSWAWGSGDKTAVKQIQRVLGVTRDGIIGKQTLGAINKSNEVELFAECIKAREMFFRYISNPMNASGQKQRIAFTNNQRFLKGWLNRLADFDKKFKPK